MGLQERGGYRLRVSRTARRPLFALISTVILLGSMEGGARLAPDEMTLDRRGMIREALGERVLMALGDVPGWDVDPGGDENWGTTYTVDEYGMRSPGYDDADGPTQRVIFLGDSSIFGVGLDWDETFAARFESIRESRLPDYDLQTATCACPGHSTYQSLRKLEHCLDFEPDVVVIANLYSDSTRASLADSERWPASVIDGHRDAMEWSAFYKLVRNLFLSRQLAQVDGAATVAQAGSENKAGETVRRVTPEDYEQNLRRIVARVEAEGATPVFLMLPSELDIGIDAFADYLPYREVMYAVSDELDIPIADGPTHYATVPYGRMAFIDHLHPSALGALELAGLLDRTVPDPK